jgi:pilus assembly protein Flp/PilA
MFLYALASLKSFLKNDEGITAVEYGLIAAAIGGATIGSLSLVGNELNTTMGTARVCLGATTSFIGGPSNNNCHLTNTANATPASTPPVTTPVVTTPAVTPPPPTRRRGRGRRGRR